ncbi:MAG: putative threonine efflux protein [Paenibacillaceae bacterium]|jgi:threonine/homoserine/homoserine lactone efflux protein|nr:putative threonine efflux protein [Paenibacillaceae bacterium]
MVHFSALLRGCVFGFSVAAPIGPIGLICMHRTLSYGRKYGFVSGLGAATADMVCAAFACFGITSVLLLNNRIEWLLRLAGSVYLCYLGLRILNSRSSVDREGEGANPLGGMYLSIVLLTLGNPITWMSFAGGFAGLGMYGENTAYASSLSFICGVFIGSSLWWLVLSLAADKFRTRLNNRIILGINRVSGGAIACFGVWAALAVFR